MSETKLTDAQRNQLADLCVGYVANGLLPIERWVKQAIADAVGAAEEAAHRDGHACEHLHAANVAKGIPSFCAFQKGALQRAIEQATLTERRRCIDEIRESDMGKDVSTLVDLAVEQATAALREKLALVQSRCRSIELLQNSIREDWLQEASRATEAEAKLFQAEQVIQAGGMAVRGPAAAPPE